MINSELISIIMPVLNGERFIQSAILSILNQTSINLEIIVVNDGSTDSTPAVVSQLAIQHPNIRMIDGPKSGVANARNAGLSALNDQCHYVGFLDADDLYPPGRIARQLKLMQMNPQVQWVIGLVQIFESLDEETLTPAAGSRHMTLRTIQLGSALFRREVLHQLNGFLSDMTHGEDTDLFLRLLESDTPYLSEEHVAVLYRRHDSNITNQIEASRKGFMIALKRSVERRQAGGQKNISLGSLFKSRLDAENEIGNTT